jgi:hypothetical protein
MDELIRKAPWIFYLLIPVLGFVVLVMHVEEKVFQKA